LKLSIHQRIPGKSITFPANKQAANNYTNNWKLRGKKVLLFYMSLL